MIPYQPSPIIFTIGPLAIRYYSIAYLIGFVLAYFWLAKRFGKETAEDSLFWIVLATIIGGRLGEFVFYSPITFWTDPLEILKIWHGGMSFHGGLIALVLVTFWYCRKHKIKFLDFADTLVVPGALALGLGRIANFLNGELVGTVTNLPWCMNFPGYIGCRHPSQLYEAAYSFLLAGILYWQYRKKHEAGFMLALFVTLYGLFRFIENFVRDEPRILGLSMGQVLSLIMLIIGAYFLSTKYKKSVSRMFA